MIKDLINIYSTHSLCFSIDLQAVVGKAEVILWHVVLNVDTGEKLLGLPTNVMWPC